MGQQMDVKGKFCGIILPGSLDAGVFVQRAAKSDIGQGLESQARMMSVVLRDIRITCEQG